MTVDAQLDGEDAVGKAFKALAIVRRQRNGRRNVRVLGLGLRGTEDGTFGSWARPRDLGGLGINSEPKKKGKRKVHEVK